MSSSRSRADPQRLPVSGGFDGERRPSGRRLELPKVPNENPNSLNPRMKPDRTNFLKGRRTSVEHPLAAESPLQIPAEPRATWSPLTEAIIGQVE